MDSAGENKHHEKKERTEAQKEASRINGSKSNGPTTLNGKDKSSRNALRHGLTAFDLALSNEDAEAFNNVLADYTAEYLPEGPTETNLVEQTETAIYNIEMDLNKQTGQIASQTGCKNSRNYSFEPDRSPGNR